MTVTMNFTGILLFMVNCILVNNYIFSRFLGCCPFLGVSKKVGTALGMGFAVTFVMGVSSVFTWLCYHYILAPLDVTYLSTLSFIVVIASLVQFVEMFMKKSLPSLYNALGIYLPLITTNCAVLGAALLNITEEYTLVVSVLNGVFSALGFTLAIVVMAGVRERLESSKIPKCMKGFPISLITAGLLSIAFMGFKGMV